MLVRVYEDLEQFEDFEFAVTNIRDILCGIKMVKGEEYTEKLTTQEYKFILLSKDEEVKPIALNSDTLFSDFEGFDCIVIMKETSGSTGAEIAAFFVAVGAYGTAAAVPAWVIVTTQIVIAVAVSMAVSGIMSLLSPTSSFSSDPSQAQKKSNLFNGAPVITEQGGSVPLWYGESYAGGVLISSSVSTSEG